MIINDTDDDDNENDNDNHNVIIKITFLIYSYNDDFMYVCDSLMFMLSILHPILNKNKVT